MAKKVKSTKAAAKVITAETKKKKATSSYQDEVNTKTLDLIDAVSENVKIQSERIDIVNQRLDIISQKLDKVSNRVGIV
jgi:hypothetical protein